MTQPVRVELFIIGNEILIGDIQDTNTNWLCKQIHCLGGQVIRATMLRDTEEVIAAELQAALTREPQVIITSGGLGPTADDLTLAAVARGAGVVTELHEQARQMVKERYDELAAQGVLSQGGLNPPREKMAWLPKGAIPLHNSDGTAPGVLLQAGNSTIISLPGVPSELKTIFSSSLQPFLRKTFSCGTSAMRTIAVECNDESLMEPVLSRVTNGHPHIYIKSLATTIGISREIDITFTAVGSEQTTLDSMLEAAMIDLQSGLTSLGFRHREKQRQD
jgi:molybdenum cofactor synthesis domain-containing protein